VTPGKGWLRLAGVTKRFGHVRALKGIDLELQAGECVALLGPNGAGKSTLLRIVAGLMKPTSGQVLLDGRPASSDPLALRRRLGFVGHATMLHGCLTARESLTFAGRLHGVPQLRFRTEALLRELDLVARAGDPVDTLSRGMQQRVALARALLHDPELLLLDEPHSGLDEPASRVLAALLAGLRKRRRTIVLVTHDLARGVQLADRVVILVEGSVAADLPAAAIDRARFAESYLECIRLGALPATAMASGVAP
jgi:heme exporter protein A